MSAVLLLFPVAGVVFMELFRAIGPFKFVAFAGCAQQRNGHQQQGEKFHRGAS
jgi:hypothetical protein